MKLPRGLIVSITFEVKDKGRFVLKGNEIDKFLSFIDDRVFNEQIYGCKHTPQWEKEVTMKKTELGKGVSSALNRMGIDIADMEDRLQEAITMNKIKGDLVTMILPYIEQLPKKYKIEFIREVVPILRNLPYRLRKKYSEQTGIDIDEVLKKKV